MTKATLWIPCFLLFMACSGPSDESAVHDVPQDQANQGSTAQSPPPSPTAAPGPAADAFAPRTSRDGQGSTITSPTPADTTVDHQIEAPGASFTLPTSWTPQAPSSSMRLAQATLPGSAGEGQLTVFHFGPGGGGGVDSNLDRWAGQVEPDPGQEARRESFDVDGFRVTWLEVQGTLKPSTMGTGPTTPQPGSRLFGAVVEGPQGPWFFKATGPAQTLDEQRDAFLQVLRSVRPRG